MSASGGGYSIAPESPLTDRLDEPLTLANLPIEPRRGETFLERVRGVAGALGLDLPARRRRANRRLVAAMMALVAVSVHPRGAALLETSGWAKAARGAKRRISVYHPYALQQAIDLPPKLPAGLSADARSLEVLIAVVLRRYAVVLGHQLGGGFSFASEAREFFVAGNRLERLLTRTDVEEERAVTIQQIYRAYFHGRRYYEYSVLSREKSRGDPKVFMSYIRAIWFLARMQGDGTLRAQPAARALPSRRTLLYFISRDPAVQERARMDPAFSKKLATVLTGLPVRDEG